MAGAAPLLWVAAALGVAGVLALRFAWSLPRRSPAANAAGWGLLALSTVGAWLAEGAWGATIAALCAMLAAFTLLGITRDTPRGEARKVFRAKLTLYHPDKVSHLADEFRELAEARTRALMEAWEKVGDSLPD